MRRQFRPAVDKAIAPTGGITPEGQPLSYNRAPRAELSPWIARLYVSKVDAPADHRLDCGLFNDTACLRFQFAGMWEAETVRGPLAHGRAALYFGPHNRIMPVSVTGPFHSIGIALRPGSCNALGGPRVADHLDAIVPLDLCGIGDAQVLDRFDPDMTAEEQVVAMEEIIAQMAERADFREPDPLTLAFEAAIFTDPTRSVREIAADCDVEQRRLERVVRRDFGMAPKQVLRRARALDMASHLRGVADRDEAEALMLRYYDQSHLIREFLEFFGMTPNQFVARPQPLLTLALESRQARRLEAIERIAPGEVRPWQ